MVGVSDSRVSTYNKSRILQGDVMVTGVIGEGASKDLVVNWNSPFEEDTAGGHFQKIGGLVQASTGRTSKSEMSSMQIWEGNRPHSFNLPLLFYALTDAKKEVQDALLELEKMLSPDLNARLPGGVIPQPVELRVGRLIVDDCYITNMSNPLSGERTRDGYLVRAEVTLQIESRTLLNRSDISNTYG